MTDVLILTDILIPVVVVVVAILALGMILARLYRRASKELSFVRTGMGGQKVIINGGALVLPILHEVIPVNMNTLRLEVRRANEQALITPTTACAWTSPRSSTCAPSPPPTPSPTQRRPSA